MIITLTGKNSFAINEKLSQIRTEYLDKYGEAISIEEVDATDITDENNFINDLQAVSLFTSNRLIIFRYVSQNKPLLDQIIKYADKILASNTLLIVDSQLDMRTSQATWLKKHSEWHNLQILASYQLAQWLGDRCRQLDLPLSTTIQKKLLDKVKDDQLLLASELDKLRAYGGEISGEVLDDLVPTSIDDNIFSFLDALCSNNIEKANGYLEDFKLTKTDPHYVFNMLVWQFNVLAVAIFNTAPASELAHQSGLSEGALRRAIQNRNSISKARLKKYLNALAEIDLQMKKSNTWARLEYILTV